jgi:uncharacterized membrane protein
MAREIKGRLAVRRRFYKRAFLVLALVELAISVPTAYLYPDVAGYILWTCTSALLGTAAVLVWAYLVRESELYEKAGRTLLARR